MFQQFLGAIAIFPVTTVFIKLKFSECSWFSIECSLSILYSLFQSSYLCLVSFCSKNVIVCFLSFFSLSLVNSSKSLQFACIYLSHICFKFSDFFLLGINFFINLIDFFLNTCYIFCQFFSIFCSVFINSIVALTVCISKVIGISESILIFFTFLSCQELSLRIRRNSFSDSISFHSILINSQGIVSIAEFCCDFQQSCFNSFVLFCSFLVRLFSSFQVGILLQFCVLGNQSFLYCDFTFLCKCLFSYPFFDIYQTILQVVQVHFLVDKTLVQSYDAVVVIACII